MSLFFKDLLPAIQDDVLKAVLKSAMVIRANNVSEYLYLRSDRERWYNAHFHNVAPPAPVVWPVGQNLWAAAWRDDTHWGP